jgi:hypothetical protein
LSSGYIRTCTKVIIDETDRLPTQLNGLSFAFRCIATALFHDPPQPGLTFEAAYGHGDADGGTFVRPRVIRDGPQ